jgi:hypothetical protein
MKGEAGDVWTWAAIDADTKLIPFWYIGDRSGQSAWEFLTDLRFTSRKPHSAYQRRPQGLSGGCWWIIRDQVDFAQLVKIYGREPGGERRYSPPECIRAVPTAVYGDPLPKSTSVRHLPSAAISLCA